MKQRHARALIADGNPLFIAGLEAVIAQHPEIGELRSVGTERELFERLNEGEAFDLVLVSDTLSDRIRKATLSGLIADCSEAVVLILCDRIDRAEAFAHLSAGAHGVISKLNSVTELHKAVTLVLEGNVYLPVSVTTQTPKSAISAEVETENATLTSRQSEILDLVAIGKSNKEIARLLGIAEATVKVHLGTIYRHFGVHNRTSAVAHINRSSHSEMRLAVH